MAGTTSLDFGAFTPAELSAMLTAAKAELLIRITTGKVSQGSSAAQSYGLTLMTLEELKSLLNGLTEALNLSNVDVRVEPNFNHCGRFDTNSTFGAT